MTRAELVTLALIAVVWSPVLGADWFWDDHALILDNPATAQLDLLQIFASDLWAGAGIASGFYRPLAALSFVLDRAVGGPAFAHLHSLAWHLVATALVGLLARGRAAAGPGLVPLPALREVGPSVLTMLVFGLHPIQSEAVVWVAARNDLMSTTFVLAALLAGDRGKTGLVALLALCAGLSKESGLGLPVLMVLWNLAWRERWHANLVASGIGVFVALLLRAGAAIEAVPPTALAAELAMGAPGRVLATVLGWLVLPWPLTSSASLYQSAPGAVPFVVATITLVVLGLSARTSGAGRPTFLLFFSLVAWAPSLYTVYTTHTIGERYLYLPLVGLALLAARVPFRVVFVLPVVLAILTIQVRLTDWRSEDTVWRSAAERAPDAWSLFGLGIWERQNGRPREALHALRQSALSNPPFPPACAESVRVLLDVDAKEAAATLAAELAANGCSDAEFQRLSALTRPN